MFVGDPHGRYHHIIDDVKANPSSMTILLGDQCYDSPIDIIFECIDSFTSLRWIHGNHDTDNKLWFDNLFDTPWVSRNIHAQVEMLGGLRVAGLGGIFRPKIWHPNSGVIYGKRADWNIKYQDKRFAQLRRKNKSSIWYEDYEYLSSKKADVLVTHEAPSSHKFGFKVLDNLAEAMGVRLMIHGHHHKCYSDVLGNGVAVVGLGLAQIAHMNVETFRSAKNNKEIFNAFKFINNAKGGELT